MGKENPRLGNHNNLNKILVTARNVGLTVAFIGGGLAFDSCKKPSSPSQTPAGISEKVPQFPNTGSDRPMQSQSKETQGSTQKETPKSMPAASVEKPVEQGWTTFTSLNYPYRIDVPPGWTANSRLGEKLDIFGGNVITIFSEPVNKWVSLDDYANNYFEQIGSRGFIKAKAKEIQEQLEEATIRDSKGNINGMAGDELDRGGYRISKPPVYAPSLVKRYGDRKIVNKISDMSKLKIANRPTEIVASFGNAHRITAITLIDKNAFQFTLSTSLGTEEEEMVELLDKFEKMLKSFRLLK